MPAKLLLADDSVTIQRVIELTFANEDIRVVAVSDGQAALQQLDSDPPDIVLADVSMAKLDGYGVASHVKRSPALKEIPVLLLTGAFEPIDDEKARASGCDGVLVKPFEPQELISRVKELLAVHRTPVVKPADVPRIEPVPFAAVHSAGLSVADSPVPMPPSPVADDPAVWSFAEPGPVTLAPSVDEGLDIDFNQFDVALARLDPVLSPGTDRLPDSEFARDLEIFGNSTTDVESSISDRASFGNWDIPKVPPKRDEPDSPFAQHHSSAGESIHPGTPAASGSPPALAGALAITPEVWAPPAAVPSSGAAPVSQDVESPGPPSPDKVSTASGFSARLVSEQAQPARFSHPTPEISEATIEEMVHRVLARMTEETVRRIVLDTAERLIREEIEKIKADPE